MGTATVQRKRRRRAASDKPAQTGEIARKCERRRDSPDEKAVSAPGVSPQHSPVRRRLSYLFFAAVLLFRIKPRQAYAKQRGGMSQADKYSR
jgi:hypothetical protein